MSESGASGMYYVGGVEYHYDVVRVSMLSSTTWELTRVEFVWGGGGMIHVVNDHEWGTTSWEEMVTSWR